MNNSMKVNRSNIDYVIQKPDVDIVYLKTGKHFVCMKNCNFDEEICTLIFAPPKRRNK